VALTRLLNRRHPRRGTPTATGPTATYLTATGPTATGSPAAGPTATGSTATGPTATGRTATARAAARAATGRAAGRTAAVLAVATAAALIVAAPPAYAADAPGAPGTGSAWTTGGKQGIGTTTTAASTVWFTLGQGIAHEVYYPSVDVANVQDLQYVVSDGSGFTQLERDATTRQIVLTDQRSLSYQQVNTATNGRYRITKSYTADPARPSVLIQTRFQVLTGGPLNLYVLYNPSLNNSGMGDTGGTVNGQLVSSDGPVASALAASTGFTATTSGYGGSASDGYVDLAADHVLTNRYDTANTAGNLVQLGQVPVGADTTFVLALGFGANRTAAAGNASASLAGGYAAADTAYRDGWHAYLASLAATPASVTAAGLGTQYNVAVMTLKAHEDKTHPGANVASLTNPWGEAKNANSAGDCGYHAVWARDLYQVSTAQLAAGDTAAANRSVDYLFGTQQRPDGSFPQNTHLDGTNCFGSLQLDEVSFPLILAWQLGRFDAATWAKVRLSADFLLSRGPGTPQERWEENGGFSPSTIAAEIAGLVCAADIATRNGDTAAAGRYLSTADTWQRSVENWTFTTTGPLGDGRYYERIDGNSNPNDGQNISITNGGGNFDERSIVDAGFLELVRLGVKPAGDPAVAASLPEVDATIRISTPNGPMWYRYNHDGYGETAAGGPYTGAGVGRLWPLLTGERGEYELANGRAATSHLATLAAAGNAGYLIPEQVWDRADAAGFTFGEGTGSATPLAWSMAQFVRLAHSIDAGAPVETPSVVKARYAGGGGGGVSTTVTVSVPAGTDATGRTVRLAGNLSALGSGLPDWDPAGIAMTRVDATHWRTTITTAGPVALQYKYTLGDWATVEKNGSCADVPNRTRTLTGGSAGDTVAAFGTSCGSGGSCGSVAVSFAVNATTTPGQNIYVVGGRPELGGWNPDNAVPMSAATYPVWTATVALPPNTAFQYKYIRKQGSALTWESGGNRAASTATACTLTLNDTFRT
jgi:glucoamylase